MLEEPNVMKSAINPVPAISKWGTRVLKSFCKKHRVPRCEDMDREHLIVEVEKIFKSM